MSYRTAMLIFEPLKAKRKNNSFLGNDNIGALVVMDELRRGGVEVEFCTPKTAKNYDLVLVSMTSTYDIFAYLRAVSRLKSWQPDTRAFKVLAGGFGMQNPSAIRHFVDYAYFGRPDGDLLTLLELVKGGGEFEHPSVMCLPQLRPVKVRQPPELYPWSLELATRTYKEDFVGCNNKCLFCHYTWARESKGNLGEYVNETLAGSSSPELTWKRLIKTEGKLGRPRSALDGFSERIRYLYGKRISNDEIREGVERLGAYGGSTVATVYNVANVPGETQEDRQEMYAALASARPKDRVIIVLHSTPFRPSLLTPMQWERGSLRPNWNQKGAGVIYDSPKLRVVHSTGNESPFSHLISVMAERATPKGDSDKAIEAVCFNRKLRGAPAMKATSLLLNSFDCEGFLREYEIGDDEHPGNLLEGYISADRVRRIAKRMRVRAQAVGLR